MKSTQFTPFEAAPLWVPLAPVCKRLGLTPRMLAREAASGRLPIRLAKFGDRGLVRALYADVAAYENSLKGNPK